jgi:UDP-N-acetylmuramate dehydrogenase
MYEYTSFKIGGPADILIIPDTKETLSAVLEKCRELGVSRYILGKGSNVLIPDEGLRGAVILTTRLDAIQTSDDGVLRCEAGVSLSSLCRFALTNSLTGLEFAYGIPGTVGGAVYMNAGAYGGEMKDLLYPATM